MRTNDGILAVVDSSEEVENVLRFLKGNRAIFIALTLEAEFYLKSKLKSYENPIYDLVGKNELDSKDYIFPNFEIAYSWSNGTYYEYVKDRLGYWLAEIDRSLDFAKKAVDKLKPRLIIIGELKVFTGASVLNGTLNTNAFQLIAKKQKIPYKLLSTKSKNINRRQFIGEIIKWFRFLKKQKVQSKCDLVLLATPRHLIQMGELIHGLSGSSISTKCLTYNLTLDYKDKLDKINLDYLEKERLMTNQVRTEGLKNWNLIVREKAWKRFKHPRYRNVGNINSYIQEKLKQITYDELNEVLIDLTLAKKVLTDLSPKVLLVTTDPDTKVLTFINAAKELGIKTVCLQHGAFFAFDSPSIYPVSDYFITWSEASKKWLERNKYFKSIKMLVGQSPFHKLKKVSTKRPANKYLTILLLATVHLVDDTTIFRNLKKLFEVIGNSDIKINLVIRAHPNEGGSVPRFNALLRENQLTGSIANKEKLEDVIYNSDLVIWENTTAGFDAMLSDKPTIYFNPYTGEDFFNVQAHKASMMILTEEDIDKIGSFLKDRRKWRDYGVRGHIFAKKFLGIGNGKVNKNVKILKELLTKND